MIGNTWTIQYGNILRAVAMHAGSGFSDFRFIILSTTCDTTYDIKSLDINPCETLTITDPGGEERQIPETYITHMRHDTSDLGDGDLLAIHFESKKAERVDAAMREPAICARCKHATRDSYYGYFGECDGPISLCLHPLHQPEPSIDFITGKSEEHDGTPVPLADGTTAMAVDCADFNSDGECPNYEAGKPVETMRPQWFKERQEREQAERIAWAKLPWWRKLWAKVRDA